MQKWFDGTNNPFSCHMLTKQLKWFNVGKSFMTFIVNMKTRDGLVSCKHENDDYFDLCSFVQILVFVTLWL